MYEKTNKIMKWLSGVEDKRQQKKVKHSMRDIVAIVFFATIANADDWMEIYYFAEAYKKILRKYLVLQL